MKRGCFVLLLTVVVPFFFQAANRPTEVPPPISSTAGTWTGHGAGEEVRYRHKLGLLTLTVRHETEFMFVVDDQGNIEGEGTIVYDLTNNTTGLDSLVASVHGLMNMAGSPALPKSTYGGSVSDKSQKAADLTRNVEGVTRIQYNAPHLKKGKEVRRFRFTGRIVAVAGKSAPARLGIYIDPVAKYVRIGGKEDNELIAEYEVNRVTEESTFPCWSPFLVEAAVVRRGPGKLQVAEFVESGKHRQNKQVWEEYNYVWLARQVQKEE